MIVAAVPLFNIFAVVVLTFKAHPADSSEAVKAGRGNNIKKAFVNILNNGTAATIISGAIPVSEYIFCTNAIPRIAALLLHEPDVYKRQLTS